MSKQGKKLRIIKNEHQRNIVRLIDTLVGRYSHWEIWQDFIIMSAISIANSMGGTYHADREKEYLSRAAKYTEQELSLFAEMLSEVIQAFEENPEQDFLGELFMSLGLSNEWKGQFFTPYTVCRMMGSITIGDVKEQIAKQGWISVNDPACGAGALLIAFANECRRPENDINYQTSVLFVAQDIDFLAGCMCYIQLSLLGCPGYVVIGDSIATPCTSYDGKGLISKDGPNIWYTPMYYRDVWQMRKYIAKGVE